MSQRDEIVKMAKRRRELVKRHLEPEPTDEEVAEMIVCYYNGTDIAETGMELPGDFTDELRRGLVGIVTAVFVKYYHRLPNRIQPDIIEVSEIMGTSEPSERRTFTRSVSELAAKRKNFRTAVRWLCSLRESPKIAAVKTEKDLPDKTWAMTRRSIEQKVIAKCQRCKLADDVWRAYFECHGQHHFQREVGFIDDRLFQSTKPIHIIDLFCAFLLKGAESGHAQMPVKLCTSCGKLFSVAALRGGAREKKENCSMKCQQKRYWKARRTDLRYVERLIDLSPPPKLRDRMRTPKVQARLQQIEQKWARWPGILNKVATLREQSARAESKERKRS